VFHASELCQDLPAVNVTPESGRCARCAKTCPEGFRLERDDGPAVVCLRCALREPPLVLRSVCVALVVGTVLTIINQGGLIASGAWTPALAWKIPLTYLVPFAVAMWGALTSARQRKPR